MKELESKKTLKVTATFKELDYTGEVKTIKLTKEIPFSFDSEDFIKYAIKNGSYKGYRKPFAGYYNDLMKEYFKISSHEKVWRPVSVESETVANLAKFVFQKHNEDKQIMDWEDVK